MRTRKQHRRAGVHQASSGFTRVELVVAAVVALLLTGVLFEAGFFRSRHVVSHLTCSVNLRQLGLAVRLFADNHAGYPWAVSTNQGGTLEFDAVGSGTFRHFQVLSNDIYVTLGVVCPQDTRKAATNWAGMANTNVSYFVGLDSDPKLPHSIMAGDRNITASEGIILRANNHTPPPWVKRVGLHGDKGHILFGDGHVEVLDSSGLSNALQRTRVPTHRLAVP
jgi:prepilin-type processing-associated H-X9-DG protein